MHFAIVKIDFHIHDTVTGEDALAAGVPNSALNRRDIDAIHALSGEQDMRKMGALWAKIPTTARTFVAGSIAIAGIPPLAGFFSKMYVVLPAIGAGLTWLAVIAVVIPADAAHVQTPEVIT